MSNGLGSFTHKYDCAGKIAYIRGLTVAEYVDLAQRGFFSSRGVNTAHKMAVLECGLVGWDYSTLSRYEEELIGLTPMEIAAEEITTNEMVKMADFILNDMTSVSDLLDEKLRGYTRYVHKMSKPENKKEADSFKCQTCILSGKHQSRARFCGKFTLDQAAKIKIKLLEDKDSQELENLEVSIQDEIQEAKKLEAVQEASGKYRSTGHRKRRSARKSPTQSQKTKAEYIVINKFKFPECPVSWLDEWIWISGGILYDAEKSGVPLFSGGLFDQPYKLYQAARTVASEFSKIDYEEHKLAERKR